MIRTWVSYRLQKMQSSECPTAAETNWHGASDRSFWSLPAGQQGQKVLLTSWQGWYSVYHFHTAFLLLNWIRHLRKSSDICNVYSPSSINSALMSAFRRKSYYQSGPDWWQSLLPVRIPDWLHFLLPVRAEMCYCAHRGGVCGNGGGVQ